MRVVTGIGQAGKRLAVDPVTRAAAVRFEGHQPCLDQHFQMLRDGGLREVEFLHDVAAAARILPCEMLQDLYARRMRQRGKARRELARGGVRPTEENQGSKIFIVHRR